MSNNSQQETSLVITVPVYKERLSGYEEISINRLIAICPHYPIRFFAPEGLNVSYYINKTSALSDVGVETFDKGYFKDVITYSKLLTRPLFYKRFESYEYLLIYQPDALIFRDDLGFWCSQGYDYIGAPFFRNYVTEFEKAQYIGVGNGGFSLRKISSMLRILHSWKMFYDRDDVKWLKRGKNWKGRIFYEGVYLLGYLGVYNNTFHLLNGFKGYEDFFWGYFAGPKFSWMKFPDYNEALKFSFEFNCKRLYADNNFQLPTGCHRWWGPDKDFWMPILQSMDILRPDEVRT
ncbi:MAG TPA: DUF5672 family protein [Cyclobacteriaceae bacterium]